MRTGSAGTCSPSSIPWARSGSRSPSSSWSIGGCRKTISTPCSRAPPFPAPRCSGCTRSSTCSRLPIAVRWVCSFMHIDDLRAKNWLITRLEDSEYHRRLSQEEKRRILTKLTDAEIFEQFIHKKFQGAKRFFPRRRRDPDSPARPGPGRGRRPGGQGSGDRHGPPRAPERAGEHSRQEPAGGLSGVRRRRCRGLYRSWRREIPSGLQQRSHHRRRRFDATSLSVSTRATSSSSIRWPWGGCEPSRSASETKSTSSVWQC